MYHVQAVILPFNGNLPIKDFFDWISKVKHFSDLMVIPSSKMVTLVVYKFKIGVTIYWH